MCRALFTTSGRTEAPGRWSWEVRGRQLAPAMGAIAVLNATDADLAKADLVIAVKVVQPDLLARIRKRGCPWVLDIVDAWPQPAGNAWDAETAVSWLNNRVEALAPSAVVCATKAMQHALKVNVPSTTIYHHARPGQSGNPIRQAVTRVGYEGSERYLEGWRGTIERECKTRGWSFVVNPPSLDWLDIVVALRGGPWGGYANHHWKSNVKLANAQGTGTPIICQPAVGYTETASGGEVFVTEPSELPGAFDLLADRDERYRRSSRLRLRAMSLEAIADEYRLWLVGL